MEKLRALNNFKYELDISNRLISLLQRRGYEHRNGPYSSTGLVFRLSSTFTYQLKSEVYYENHPVKCEWGIFLRGEVTGAWRLPPTPF
jgi:hypothetical protein